MNTTLSSLAMVLLFASSAFAQFDSAEVLGTARDSSGAVLAGVNVTLLNEGAGVSVKTGTDSTGNYNFFNVRAGAYVISAEREGFRPFSTPNLSVNVAARQRVDITMEVGGLTETVSVVDAAEVLETDRS